jgi:hypothetical protein
MLDVIPTFGPLPELTPEDEAYIRGEFFPLKDLCLGRQGHASDCRNRIRSVGQARANLNPAVCNQGHVMFLSHLDQVGVRNLARSPIFRGSSRNDQEK